MFRSAAKTTLPLLWGLLLLWGVWAHAQEAASAIIRDFSGATRDIKGSVVDMGGKTLDLQVKETDTEIRIELAADVLFDFDKSTIKPAAAAELHKLAEFIRDKAKGRAIRIDGHTDSKGNAAYNQKRSEQRAKSVKQWLIHNEGLGSGRAQHRA